MEYSSTESSKVVNKNKAKNKNVITINKFNIDDFKMSDMFMRKLPNGTSIKRAYFNFHPNGTEQGKSFYLQTPEMKSPFGAGCYGEDQVKKWSIELSFSQDSEDKFMNNIKKIDNFCIENAFANSKSWFNKANMKKDNIDLLNEQVHIQKKPFLGICIGMQILSTTGHEFGNYKGLNWINGDVTKIDSDTLPHVGWNNIILKKNSNLTKNLNDESSFYFVNSFHFKPKNSDYIVAETLYEHSFCSIIEKENIFGVQFHPEKSQKAGQLLLNNFLTI